MLIGLTGQAGSGKDTIYERVKFKYPNAERIAFADKLKESAAALLGVTYEQLNNWKNDSKIRLVVERQGALFSSLPRHGLPQVPSALRDRIPSRYFRI
jgi:hypothetical protein